MNKNTIKFIIQGILIVAVILINASCKKSFLDIVPKDQLTAQSIFADIWVNGQNPRY